MNKETLVIYIAKNEGDWITVDGDLLTTGRCTRILQESYDFRSIQERNVEIGERLFVSSRIGNISRSIPTDWVVTSFEQYQSKINDSGFQEVIIAYCERVPLSLEEFQDEIYDNEVC